MVRRETIGGCAMLRYIGNSAVSAALGLIIIGLGFEAYRYAELKWYARH